MGNLNELYISMFRNGQLFWDKIKIRSSMVENNIGLKG